jgi:hypothetical protein
MARVDEYQGAVLLERINFEFALGEPARPESLEDRPDIASRSTIAC